MVLWIGGQTMKASTGKQGRQKKSDVYKSEEAHVKVVARLAVNYSMCFQHNNNNTFQPWIFLD